MNDSNDPEFGQVPAVITTSKVVTTVYDRILQAIQNGTLLPGQHISDGEIAEQFGVSRTPVREAIQRLREIGLIEASSGRFTRVVDVTPEQTEHAYIVWRALYAVLINEVIPDAPARAFNVMMRDNASFLAAVPTRDARELARTNLDFFSRLPPESSNVALQRAINSVVHILSIGGQHLPTFIDLQALIQAQELLLQAVRDHDLVVARQAMVVLGEIEIPVA
ncbi:GntR family transcriptional regulator [Salinibacterium sp. G-O1]|uniref:GntR family transcriptional regulator n=1 Tax=Salinibacterium sp. G-O1 TaxID=3046208 RepID=UPI0024BB3DB9|nr:GntR family transcriptional regulator [Salinibacterium sp. G-O1]MDJ0333761.1 GntR family transcriptional regulator [Salinibacterium sp. G-O1]